jgi:hypothetical protein
MRNYSKVAVAVAATLGTASAFAATNPNYTLDLTVAGSSAMRDAVIAEFTNVLCTSGTVAGPFVSTQGTPAPSGENPDFRALTCTLGANAGSTLSGTVTALYYRSEGGSVFGIFGNPSLNAGTALPINRLNIGPAGGAQPASFAVFETVAQLEADTQTGAVIKDTVDLGVSDVEPAALIGENYGSEYTFIPYAAPTKAQLTAVPNFGPVVGEVYAPIVSNSGGTAGFASSTGLSTAGLTSQELATIYSGGVTDWSLVPSAAAAGGSGPITICRRDAGSGTQTVTSAHFLSTNCSPGGGLPFANAATAGVTVITNFATGDVLNCVKANPGSIGLATLQTAAKLTGASATQVMVDGVQGTAINSAQGKYTYYAEAYFIKNNQVTDAKKVALINKLVTDLESAKNVPASASVPNLVALPKFNAPFSPVTPFATGQQIPIAIGSTGGNVCSPLIDQL